MRFRDSDELTNLLRGTVISLIHRNEPDLTARQLGIFLTCYLQPGPHTVRGLAIELNIGRPAVSRALDHLYELEFVRRKIDPRDRRSVLVQKTAHGAEFLRDLKAMLVGAAGHLTVSHETKAATTPSQSANQAKTRLKGAGHSAKSKNPAATKAAVQPRL